VKRLLVLALGTILSLSCLPTGQPRLITVYVPDIAVSLPLPQGWTSAANQQGGYRMTTFSGPSVDVPERDGIQVQVMAGPAPTDQTLREVADRFYIGEQIVLSEEPVRIGSEEGFLWTFEWERRPQSGRLLLIEREGLLYGVFATGEARSVQAYGATLDRMYEGFSIESADYFMSGSIVEMEVDPSHPVMSGMSERAKVVVERSPVFTTEEGFEGAVLAKYPGDGSPLLSGYLLGEEHLQGYAAALDVAHGDGRVLLLGMRPQWRGQPFGNFRILFNAAVYSGGVAAVAPSNPDFWEAPEEDEAAEGTEGRSGN